MATQPAPVARPAKRPNVRSAVGPIKNESITEAIRAATNERLKMRAGVRPSWSPKPFRRDQDLAKSRGEYQAPPMRKLETAARRTASQLMVDGSMSGRMACWGAVVL